MNKMLWLRVGDEIINLAQVARFELLNDAVLVVYSIPELLPNHNDVVSGSRMHYEKYTGPIGKELAEWVKYHWPMGNVALFEM